MARLGATMSSGVSEPAHLVVLFALSSGARAACEVATATIVAECDADGIVAVTVQGQIGWRCTLVLADCPIAAAVNGTAAEIGTLALAGLPLAAVILHD